MNALRYTQIIIVLSLILNLSKANAQEQASNQDMMVRIAEIEIYPEYLKEYKEILRVEAAASIKKEPGVIAIFPMLEQKNQSQIRIIEIYANKKAYESHLKTPHFQHYKTTTLKMVKSLNLVEMQALDKQSMLQIFRKLN